MTKEENEVYTGYNDIQDLNMSIQSAQKIVGRATMSMDEEQLEGATQAVSEARAKLVDANANSTGFDNEFLQQSEKLLSQCEEQLNEAKQ
ncbi:DUF2564 family protein [Cytobacillus sp. Hm23]|uniref:DUF2564 family protein n=1 Tax=Cytobacillus sp. IB215665 TaxID=3097357 RepID=UPI002A17F243|nr:DUF2564 family protein [Cytobacillus sp. IB215665]MDX8366515.1 DUF2564 family protein [Cytobacillus sp. IB215665]